MNGNKGEQGNDARTMRNAWFYPLPVDEIRHQAMSAATVFLLVFLPFTIAQIVGYLTYLEDNLMNPTFAMISFIVNVCIICGIVIFLILNMLADRNKRLRWKIFYPSLMVASILLILTALAHWYLAGTQSSLIIFFFVALYFVLTWFLRAADILALFIFGNVGIVTIVTLEYLGIVPYAPLLQSGYNFSVVYLDGRVIGINAAIYLVTVLVAGTIYFKIKKALQSSFTRMEETNERLRMEIEEHRRTQEAKEKLNQNLQVAKTEVSSLKQLLPICSRCKKIRDDQGYWKRVEEYFTTHGEMEFTHGICPDCVQEVFGEYDKPED